MRQTATGSGIAAFRASRGGGTRTPDLRFWRPPLYQLSYAPVSVGQCTERVSAAPARVRQYARRVQRHALGVLFAVLAAALAAVAAYAFAGGDARRLVVGAAAVAVAAWLATLSASAFRRRRR